MSTRQQMCYLVSHAHIDAAWLWTRDETINVCRDTFASVLNLMERYPDLCFTQSSAQYYEWMEEKYPEIFNKIKERVQEGRWEVVGGIWVEPDCNLPSGESLVRQLLYGKRYLKEKLGIDVKVGWLPDSFGFPWTLPQIYKKSGINYFLTAKLNYETTLPFPYNIFQWQSPDGSRILGCQTVGGYGENNPEAAVGQLRVLKRRHGLDDLILITGCGDHGGGPTAEIIDRAIELSNHENFPRIGFSTAKRYFDRLQELTAQGKQFPVVNDELYLKTHRGTYTTQAEIKRSNRVSECLLESAEKCASFAKWLGVNEYPKMQLKRAWKKLLFNQFHDIIAGSSIPQVYEESKQDFKEITELSRRIILNSLKKIAAIIDTSGEGTSILIFNPLAWKRNGLVEIDLQTRRNYGLIELFDSNGKVIPLQITDSKLIFVADDIPSMGYKEYKAVVSQIPSQIQTNLKAWEDQNSFVLENDLYRVQIDKETGLLTSIYDKHIRWEVLQGRGNILQIYEDGPSSEDAWNINLGAITELDNPIEVKLVESGPVKATVRIKYRYSQKDRPDSIFIQDVILYHKLPWIEFKLQVDWYAEHRLAKVAFPLSFHSEWITYDIPYGYIQRRNPTSPKANTTERAKWEVSGQKWIDCYDKLGSRGISLINDCKYGFDAQNNVVRMTLLRSPNYPDPLEDPPESPPITDQGKHTIGYAFCTHRGDWRKGKTVKRGYEFNYPLLVHIESSHLGKLPKSSSFVEVCPDNIILSVIKEAEDSNETILRIYEFTGQDTQTKISFMKPPKRGWETDLLEKTLSELPIYEGELQIKVGHHDIKTIKISEKRESP